MNLAMAPVSIKTKLDFTTDVEFIMQSVKKESRN